MDERKTSGAKEVCGVRIWRDYIAGRKRRCNHWIDKGVLDADVRGWSDRSMRRGRVEGSQARNDGKGPWIWKRESHACTQWCLAQMWQPALQIAGY